MEKKTANHLRMLLLSFCFIFLLKSWRVSASVAEISEDYELGEVYEGNISYNEKVRSFSFILWEKSRVTLNLKCSRGRCSGAINYASGKKALKREDLEFERNYFTGESFAKLSRILPAGAYDIEIQNEGKWKWQTCRFSFWIQAQSFQTDVKTVDSPTIANIRKNLKNKTYHNLIYFIKSIESPGNDMIISIHIPQWNNRKEKEKWQTGLC
ncbi:hypothetical protein C806_03100 [Lachnospiraceae bacterium 3-1]|nr:hypothetical protein C806_03100 [Lachnospiraceae bacterium 3-1]